MEKKLIDSNVATRKGKGSKYADKLLTDYINEIRINRPNEEIGTDGVTCVCDSGYKKDSSGKCVEEESTTPTVPEEDDINE